MFEGLILGAYIPGKTCLHKLDPRTKLIGLILIIFTFFLKNSPFTYLVNILLLLSLLKIAKISLGDFLKGFKPFVIIAVISFFANSFLVSGEIILAIGEIKITHEGIYTGLLMALRLLLLVGYSLIFTFTTSPFQLTQGLDEIFKPLTKIGLPVAKFTMMVNIAIRFLPTLAYEADRIIKAQVARGAILYEGNIIKRIYSLVPIIVPLFVSTVRRAEELALAMEARCYSGDKRTSIYKLKFEIQDYLTFILVSLFVFLNLILE